MFVTVYWVNIYFVFLNNVVAGVLFCEPYRVVDQDLTLFLFCSKSSVDYTFYHHTIHISYLTFFAVVIVQPFTCTTCRVRDIYWLNVVIWFASVHLGYANIILQPWVCTVFKENHFVYFCRNVITEPCVAVSVQVSYLYYKRCYTGD